MTAEASFSGVMTRALRVDGSTSRTNPTARSSPEALRKPTTRSSSDAGEAVTRPVGHPPTCIFA